MGFGPELWCPQGHSALLRLQDSELRLLELMKKWMSQRAKSDREYAGMLHHMFSQLEKQEGPGQLRAGHHSGQIGESWWVLASQTEILSQILRRHAEELAAGPLAKLSLLIRDKQQLRKAFSEQWQHLSQEYARTTQQEMEKLKAQYRNLARDSAQAKRKYQEASKGACQSSPGPPPAPSPSCCVPSRLASAPSGSAGAPHALWYPQSSLGRAGAPGVAAWGESSLAPRGAGQMSCGLWVSGNQAVGWERPCAPEGVV